MNSDKKPIRLLCLFDYGKGVNTGYATVSKNLVSYWKKHYGERLFLDIIAINYYGEPYKEDERTAINNAYFSEPKKEGEPIKFPDKIGDAKNDEFGRVKLLHFIHEHEYDLVFILNDLGIACDTTKGIYEALQKKRENNKKQFKSILYFPVDSHVFPKLVRGLQVFDSLVTYTQFGKIEMLKTNPKLQQKLSIIPHGTNLHDFYYVEDRDHVQEFRKKYFGDNADKFIIGNINRNQPRKDIPTTILGFLKFKETHPNSLLYLHMNPKDPLGNDLRAVISQLPLKEGVDVMFPPEDRNNHGTDISELNMIYNSLDAFITTNKGEGWGLCLDSSTLINMKGSVKTIDKVTTGEYVMTNEGDYQKVLDTTCRIVESLIHLKTKFGYSVKATHEHPFYILSNNKLCWKKAAEINKNDYVGIRKPTGNKPLPEIIDLGNYLPEGWVVNDDVVYHPFGFSPKDKEWSYNTIINKYKTTKKVAENAKSFINGDKKSASELCLNLVNRMIADGYIGKSQIVKYKRYINVDDDLLWLMGLFAADGNASNMTVEFNINTTTKAKYKDKILNIIHDKFGIEGAAKKVRGKKLTIKFCSGILYSFFKTECGVGAYNKKVPSLFMGCEKYLIPFVKGYLSGDGHISFERNTISFSTVSPSLCYHVMGILNCNGIFSIITKISKKSWGNYDSFQCRIPNADLDKYLQLSSTEGTMRRNNTRKHKREYIETSTHFFVPVKNIEIIKEETEVFDLCVENSHTFIGNGLVCHNTVTEAMRCKVPVVAPVHTAIEEISNYGKNIWGLTEFDFDCQVVDNIFRYKCLDFDVVEQLENVVNASAEEKKKKIDDAHDFVSKLTWQESAKKFITIFEELL